MKGFSFFILGFFSLVSLVANPIPKQKVFTSRPLVILDAGHGGWDQGAIIKYPYCEEKRLALTTTHFIKKYLEKMGYRVALTRSSDYYIPLPNRVALANRRKSELFISVHFNSCPNKIAHGMEIFYHQNQKNVKKSSASRRLAENVLKKSAMRTCCYSRGVKKANFFVLRETKMPAILVEGGFLTNPQERNLLRQRQYLDKLARGIAEGIDIFIKT